MLSTLIASAIVFVVFILANIFIFRVVKPASPVRSMALVLIAHIPLVCLVQPWVKTLGLDEAIPFADQAAITSALIFSFLCYISLQAYSVIEASITVRILVHFFHAPQKRLNLAQLQDLYPFEDLIRQKISYMVRDGLLAVADQNMGPESEQMLVATPKGLAMGQAFWRIKIFLNWGQGG